MPDKHPITVQYTRIFFMCLLTYFFNFKDSVLLCSLADLKLGILLYQSLQ